MTEYVLACTAQTIYRWGEGGAGCGASEGKKSLKKNAVGSKQTLKRGATADLGRKSGEWTWGDMKHILPRHRTFLEETVFAVTT